MNTFLIIFLLLLPLFRMEEQIYELNGAETQGNSFLWGGALSLAWHELTNQIIGEEIKVASEDEVVLKIVDDFNYSPFTKDDLSEESYYIKAGYGPTTIALINKEVKEKFPKKTTPPLETISDQSIISYAYFFKQLRFEHPFSKKEVLFKKVKTPGFSASTREHKKQINIHSYEDEENFIISLDTKSKKDQIFFIKTEERLGAEEIRQKINDLNGKVEKLGKKDKFQMPIISIQKERHITELKGVFLRNENFREYSFCDVMQIIKLKISEEGVTVENQGSIIMVRSLPLKKPKSLKLDRQFWVVMREPGKHPYLIAFVNEVGEV